MSLNSPGQTDFTTKELYELASKKYEVFHLIVEEGHCEGTRKV